jgi:hypothetical protein
VLLLFHQYLTLFPLSPLFLLRQPHQSATNNCHPVPRFPELFLPAHLPTALEVRQPTLIAID